MRGENGRRNARFGGSISAVRRRVKRCLPCLSASAYGSPIGSGPRADWMPWRAQGRVGKATEAGCVDAPRTRQHVGQPANHHPHWKPSKCPEAGKHLVLAVALRVTANRWCILHHVVFLLGSPVARYQGDQINPAIAGFTPFCVERGPSGQTAGWASE